MVEDIIRQHVDSPTVFTTGIVLLLYLLKHAGKKEETNYSGIHEDIKSLMEKIGNIENKKMSQVEQLLNSYQLDLEGLNEKYIEEITSILKP